MALTERQKRFKDEYLVDLNGTKAAERAGYSPKTAYSQGCRLLKHAEVSSEIQKALEKRSNKTGITQERVLHELEALAFSNVAEHYIADEHGNVTLAGGAPANALQAIQSIKRRFTTTGLGKLQRTTCEVEIKLWDKPGTLKLAGRHVGTKGFFEKVEVSGPDGGPIPVERVERVIVDRPNAKD